MELVHGTKENFDELIQNDLVLVDFFATWCGPCRMLGPVLEELASERSNVKIVKVDVDESASIARNYGIMSVPTLLLFKNGIHIGTKTGFFPKEVLNHWIEENR